MDGRHQTPVRRLASQQPLRPPRDRGRLIGTPDRASSYPSNTWEYPARARKSGYTYYFPLNDSLLGKDIEVVLLGMKGGGDNLKPSVWLTARDLPFTAHEIRNRRATQKSGKRPVESKNTSAKRLEFSGIPKIQNMSSVKWATLGLLVTARAPDGAGDPPQSHGF